MSKSKKNYVLILKIQNLFKYSLNISFKLSKAILMASYKNQRTTIMILSFQKKLNIIQKLYFLKV